MAARNLIDSPRRLVSLLALCTSVAYPQIYASNCCSCDEKRGFACPIRAVGNASVSEYIEFNGRHIPDEQKMVLGYGEDYCKAIMKGKELIPHIKNEEDESDDDGFFCKCNEGDYMAFFGMCMPKRNGQDPLHSKVIDGVMFGKENFARLLPPANTDGLDNYSFFFPLIIEKGARALYVSPADCFLNEEGHTALVKYDGSGFDQVCVCQEGYYMNRMGECVADCKQPLPSNRQDDHYLYCMSAE
ncbi:MAG: hypothetical protein MHMPM18_000758 [Marteilia pararefringens]